MAGGACEYVHDVSEFPDITGNEWECPHTAVENGRCIFHLETERKTDADAVAAFHEAVTQSDWADPEAKRFLGAQFGDFDLENVRLASTDAHPIDLRGASIDGSLDWSGIHSELPVYCRDLTVDGSAVFDDAHFEQELVCSESTFGGPVSFVDATFEDDARLTDVRFLEITSFYGATFEADARFTDSQFSSHVKFTRSQISGHAQFGRVLCKQRARFADTTFDDETWFEGTLFQGVTTFTGAHFSGMAHFDGVRLEGQTQVTDTSFDGDVGFVEFTATQPVTFDNARFDRDVTVSGQIRAPISFADVRFGRRLVLTDLELPTPQTISLTGATIPDGRLEQPPKRQLTYDLTRATLGPVGIGDPDGGRAHFERYRFEGTRFEGFEFDDYSADLNGSGWIIHTTTDRTKAHDHGRLRPAIFDRMLPPTERDFSAAEKVDRYATFEGTYLRAKNGANRVGATPAAAEFFINELINRRRKHFWNAVDTDGDSSSVSSLYRWAANLCFGLTSGYGERPSYVVLFSAMLSVTFASWFAILAPGLYPNLSGYIALSTGAFVALLFGSPGPIQNYPVVSTLAHVEAILGAFLIALFVFTLTRSVHR